MLAVAYLILCMTSGFVIISFCFPKLSGLTETTFRGKPIRLCRAFILLPAWFVSGTLAMTWTTYIVAYLFRSHANPLWFGDAVSMILFFVVSALGIFFLIRKKTPWPLKGQFDRLTISEMVFITLVIALAYQLMWTTFFVSHGQLYVGLSVFSDFAPHLGMIRSFSLGNNFPTVYSHYAGEDIRYHFMFQFLVGNLEFLGMRLDLAFNIPSALSFISVFFLLYVLAVRLSGKRAVGFLSGLFFAFRCSPSFFTYLTEIPKGTSVLETINNNVSFIGYTPKEVWGLWNLNVYCNQRHLAFGISALLLVLNLFLPKLYQMAERWKAVAKSLQEGPVKTAGTVQVQTMQAEEGTAEQSEQFEQSEQMTRAAKADESYEEQQEPALQVEASQAETSGMENSAGEATAEEPEKLPWYRQALLTAKSFFVMSFLSKEGWLPEDLTQSIAAGVLLGATAFWNGATLLATLMVLFVLAIVADRRLEFLITAVITTALSLLQSSFFINGGVVDPQFQFGFISDNTSLFGTLQYIQLLCGILPLVLIAAFVVVKGVRKQVLLAFSAPFIFSFFVSLTMDVTVNHKYIMVSIMLMNIFAAILIVRLFENRNVWLRAFCCVIVLMMTITGIYDFATVLKRNQPANNLVYSMEDPLVDWIDENTTSQDIFLTASYALNRPVLGGAMLFEGHAYYPMTAGYDTYKRSALVVRMFEAETREELLPLIEQNSIDYVIIDIDTRQAEDYDVNEALFDETFEKVYTEGSGEWMISVYDTSKVIAQE